MRYIIPLCDCVLWSDKGVVLNKNVQYLCENVDNKNFIIGKNNEVPFSFNFSDTSKADIPHVKYKSHEYYFLKSQKICNKGFYQFKYQNKQVSIALFENLIVSVDGETLINQEVEDIKYSHFEVKNQICYIYFSGRRNYVVVLYGSEVKISTYYDEANISENEIYFMCKQFDVLNHGKVFYIKDKTFEEYLVYLDDNELNLKQNFVGCVFLDCVKVGNLTYANNLLSEELKQTNVENILKFFVEFDYFFPINENEFILLKKNTLAGIYSFEISDMKIINIIQQV